ncbi:MAG: prolyl oligopeptidase family serine peptidase [Planctomycetota bacterium]|jgi:dipeptidyl aminopeptidase/acylaminoacyl peptidase
MCRARLKRLTFLLLAVAPVAGAAPEPIVTTDLARIRTVASIDVAADGSKAVFAVRSIAKTPIPEAQGAGRGQAAYANRSHLFGLDLYDPRAEPRQLTFGDRRDGAPELSPDGRRIAFVRGGEDDGGKPQVWVMRADGGEARQITTLEHGAGSVRWSPDGRRLLVGSSLPIDEIEGVPPYPSERPRRAWKDAAAGGAVEPRPDGSRQEIRAWLAANARELNPTVIARLHFQDELELRGRMEFGQLFLVDPDDPELPPSRITDGFFGHHQSVFMPDGRSIVYASKKTSDVHPDRVRGTDLWRVSVGGGDDRRLLALDGWSVSHPRPSADGSVIAFIGRRLDEPTYRQWQLGLAPAEGGDEIRPVWLTNEETLDASVYDFKWHHARSALLLVTEMRGGFPLMTISRGLLEPAPLVERQEGLPVGVHAFDVGGAAIVYAVTSPSNPCRLMVRDARGQRQAYDLNPWVAGKTLSMPVEGWVSRPDGTSVQYWLMEPTNRRPGERYPLAVQIHGGPAVMWGPGELTMWHEFQLLCSWGYGVVFANPRGSGGYGYSFQRGNFQDWGEGPAGDVLAVVDQVSLTDWVDDDRLVVTGGSYAGYLTAWIVSHDHRFQAAVAQRGVYDLATFFGESNAWQLVEWSMGGYPFDARFRAVIDRNSPFTYVNRIRTPLLIMHASDDLRAGVSQSEMFYRALKQLGRPVEYVRYPQAGHDLSRTGDPRQRMDRLNRIIEFFERHIENPRPAPTVGGPDEELEPE